MGTPDTCRFFLIADLTPAGHVLPVLVLLFVLFCFFFVSWNEGGSVISRWFDDTWSARCYNQQDL